MRSAGRGVWTRRCGRVDRTGRSVASLAAVLAVALPSCGGGTNERGDAEGASGTSAAVDGSLPGDDATVDHVVDGDTIVVDGGERVRLIGIDTPETKDPREPVGCFGREAARRTGNLLAPGTRVRLAYDVERTDRYDRTLAYVYRVGDGLFVNAELVRGGYAYAYTYPPNVAHADELVALQRDAREAGRGLWGACPVDDPGSGGVGSGPVGAGGCDPAYPDTCIPSPPPDLDCADVSARRFAVAAPDPHNFDSDGNGLGCEGS